MRPLAAQSYPAPAGRHCRADLIERRELMEPQRLFRIVEHSATNHIAPPFDRVAGPASHDVQSARDVRMQFKNQIYFASIQLLNALYNVIPFFRLKHWFLNLIGVSIGRQSYIHVPVKFFSHTNLTIGNNVTVNPHCYLDARSGINIGNNVNIAHGTKVYTLGHDIDSSDLQLIGKPVNIEDDVFIFANVLIMPGVRVGKGAVVLPGSVVVKDVAPYTVVGGNPAKPVRERRHLEFAKTNYSYWFAP